MPVETLVFLFIATVLFWLWSASRARAETALAVARNLCARAGVQLLDGSVVFIGLRPARTRNGLVWRWRYRYEYSSDSVNRSLGTISIVGREADHATLPETAQDRVALH